MPDGGGGSGGGGSSTVTQVQQIPQFQQDYAQQNENIAASLASTPYPTYNADIIAGFTPQQQAGMDQAAAASTAYQPNLNSAEQLTTQASQAFQPYANTASQFATSAAQPWTAATAQQYMSPYAMAALAPQLQQLGLQQSANQKNIDRAATQAGAFGDARQGVATGLNNFYGDLAQNDLVAQGMNTAYNTGMQAFMQGQQNSINAANTLGQIGTQAANVGLASGNQMANLGQLQQQLGITGANANYNAGTQQQQLTQEQLTAAYNNFMNQVNWPAEMLNLRIAALGNSPYTTTNYTTLAPGNASAANVGAFASLAGGLGSLLGGGGQGGSGIYSGQQNVFSDRRLKKNLKRIGELLSGIPLYLFQYLDDTDAITRIGVVADEVMRVIPRAVSMHRTGFLTVDYGLLR